MNYCFELQKCPFCGKSVATIWTMSEAHQLKYDEDRERYTVVCSWDNGGCGATCGFHDSVHRAVSRWNTRVPI